MLWRNGASSFWKQGRETQWKGTREDSSALMSGCSASCRGDRRHEEGGKENLVHQEGGPVLLHESGVR